MKRERDIGRKAMLSDVKAAFRCTPALTEMKKVVESHALELKQSIFSFSSSNKVLISKSPVAPYASFVYTIHAQGIVLEHQDPPGQGEFMRKTSITFLR